MRLALGGKDKQLRVYETTSWTEVKTVKAEIRSHLASWIGGGTPQQQSAQQTLPFNPFAMLPRMAL